MIDHNGIRQGDALEFLASLPDACADLVLSPIHHTALIKTRSLAKGRFSTRATIGHVVQALAGGK